MTLFHYYAGMGESVTGSAAQTAADAVQATHPEYVRWFPLELLPRHLIGERNNGTYCAFSLVDIGDEIDVYPMWYQLIPLAALTSQRQE